MTQYYGINTISQQLDAHPEGVTSNNRCIVCTEVPVGQASTSRSQGKGLAQVLPSQKMSWELKITCAEWLGSVGFKELRSSATKRL